MGHSANREPRSYNSCAYIICRIYIYTYIHTYRIVVVFLPLSIFIYT